MNLSRDKYLLPVAFIITDSGIKVIATPFKDDNEKISMYTELGYLCAEFQATEIYTIADIAMKEYDKEHFKMALTDPLERPTLYPKSMRTDGILISYIDLATLDHTLNLQKYKETENGETIFIDNLSVIPGNKAYLLDYIKNAYSERK